MVFRRAVGQSNGLGLGWLLFIALGGGGLIFLALGLLLTWHLKKRRTPCTTRVYSWNGIPGSNGPSNPEVPRSSTHRLLKKRFATASESELGTNGWSSRISLSLPALPPVLAMPRHHSFRGRPRTNSWVDVDGTHGPQVVRRSWRESWFGVEGRLGRTPTVPDLTALEEGVGREDEDRKTRSAPVTPQRKRPMGARESPMQASGPRTQPAGTPTRRQSLQTPSEGRIEVQKRDSRIRHQREGSQQLGGSQAPAELAAEEVRGRPRMPAQAHIRPSITDTDLHDILNMTDQRLRDGTSQSPTKSTPRTSPSKRSPAKTPRSYRGVAHSTPSPSKRLQMQTPRSGSHQSRNTSVSSIGSAANSLLAEAAQQLELPGISATPTRTPGSAQSAQPAAELQQPSPAQLRYKKSVDSDASSSLSTLYSAGEPDEQDEQQAPVARNVDDVFVDNRSPSWETKALVADPRAFRRRTDVMSATDMGNESPVYPSACPSPLRPLSTAENKVEGLDLRRESLSWLRQPLVLPPPSMTGGEDVEPKGAGHHLQIENGDSLRQVSGSSMISVSVHTDDSDTELPVLESSARKSRRDDDDSSSSSRTASPSTPVRSRQKTQDMSSSPYSEEDILSMLLSNAGPKRALPLPPPRLEGADDLGPTQLSPRPRSKTTNTRPPSIASDTSSNYEGGSPGNEEDTVKPMIIAPAPNVTNTISELRRMNSMISSYSVASIASTTLGELDSPVLPALRGGGFSPSRSHSRASLLGKKNYLAIGSHSPKKNNLGAHHRSNSKKNLVIAEDEGPGKENQVLSLKIPKVDSGNVSGLREARSRGGSPAKVMSRENSARGSPFKREKKRLVPVEELPAEEKNPGGKRGSVDSLGLYDKDGFLVSSPVRDSRPRM